MEKRQKINEVFNILIQFEKIDKEDNVSEDSYRNYLDRLYVWYLGYGNNEIAMNIKGLYDLGKMAKHESVKRVVFHIISLINKEVK